MPKITGKQTPKTQTSVKSTAQTRRHTRSDGPAEPVGELPKVPRTRKAPYVVPTGQGRYILNRTNRKKQRPTEDSEESDRDEEDEAGSAHEEDDWNGIAAMERPGEEGDNGQPGDRREEVARGNREDAPTSLSQFLERVKTGRANLPNRRTSQSSCKSHFNQFYVMRSPVSSYEVAPRKASHASGNRMTSCNPSHTVCPTAGFSFFGRDCHILVTVLELLARDRHAKFCYLFDKAAIA